MTTRDSRRHMSREEREQRSLLRTGIAGRRILQFEETVWGRALLISGALVLLAGAVYVGWARLADDVRQHAKLWEFLVDVAYACSYLFFGISCLVRLIRSFRRPEMTAAEKEA